jgi:hypothetical protein
VILNLIKGSILLLVLVLSACDYGVQWEDKPYQVIWIDADYNRTLVYAFEDGESVGRVQAEVIAVGSNEKYIIAKQRDLNDKTISIFYLERSKDSMYMNSNQVTQGPFTEQEFEKLKSELNLPEFLKEF